MKGLHRKCPFGQGKNFCFCLEGRGALGGH